MRDWLPTVLLGVLIWAPAQLTHECNCKHCPWPKKCERECAAYVIKGFDSAGGEGKLELTTETKGSIAKIIREKPSASTKEIAAALDDATASAIGEAVGKLDEADRAKLFETAKEWE